MNFLCFRRTIIWDAGEPPWLEAVCAVQATDQERFKRYAKSKMRADWQREEKETQSKGASWAAICFGCTEQLLVLHFKRLLVSCTHGCLHWCTGQTETVWWSVCPTSLWRRLESMLLLLWIVSRFFYLKIFKSPGKGTDFSQTQSHTEISDCHHTTRCNFFHLERVWWAQQWQTNNRALWFPRQTVTGWYCVGWLDLISGKV